MGRHSPSMLVKAACCVGCTAHGCDLSPPLLPASAGPPSVCAGRRGLRAERAGPAVPHAARYLLSMGGHLAAGGLWSVPSGVHHYQPGRRGWRRQQRRPPAHVLCSHALSGAAADGGAAGPGWQPCSSGSCCSSTSKWLCRSSGAVWSEHWGAAAPPAERRGCGWRRGPARAADRAGQQSRRHHSAAQVGGAAGSVGGRQPPRLTTALLGEASSGRIGGRWTGRAGQPGGRSAGLRRGRTGIGG